MPDVSGDDRIARLEKARDAAQAVKDEVTRRMGIDPDVNARLRPVLQRATSEVEDANEKIDDLEAGKVAVTVDQPKLEELNAQAAQLDRAIEANALLNQGIDSLTQVLDAVSNVKDALG